MITSLALTVKQTKERPLHVAKCTITLEKDHFEFVAHHPSSSDVNNEDQGSKHIGAYRPLHPPPTKTFVVRVFFRDIAKMEIVPQISQILITTQSPSQPSFVGPAAPFLPEHGVAASRAQRNRPKFPGAESADDDDFGKAMPGKSRSPPPRPTTMTANNNAANSSTATTIGATTIGGIRRQYILLFAKPHISEVWYKAMCEAVESWAELVADGKRNALRLAELLKKRDAMDSAIFNDGDQHNDDDDGDDGNSPSPSPGHQQQRQRRGGGGGRRSPIQRTAENTVLNYHDEDLFVQQDAMDVEEAISALHHEYHRDGLGWAGKKKKRQQHGVEDEEGLWEGPTRRNPRSGIRGSKNFGSSNHAAAEQEQEDDDDERYHVNQQQRVDRKRKGLVPMWEDVAALRDSIVNKIAHSGALELAHETPPRKGRDRNIFADENYFSFQASSAAASRNPKRKSSSASAAAAAAAADEIDDDGSVADAYEPSPPKQQQRSANYRHQLQQPSQIPAASNSRRASPTPLLQPGFSSVPPPSIAPPPAIPKAPPPPPGSHLQPKHYSSAHTPPPPAPPPPLPRRQTAAVDGDHRPQQQGLLLIPGRDVSTRLGGGGGGSSPVPGPGVGGALPPRSSPTPTPSSDRSRESSSASAVAPLLSTLSQSTAVMPPAYKKKKA